MSVDDERPLMTASEVAVLFRVSPKTVNEWVRSGRLTAVRTPGGSARFRESDVQALLSDPPPHTSRPGVPHPPQPGRDPKPHQGG